MSQNNDDLTALADAVGVLTDPAKTIRQSVLGGLLTTAVTAITWTGVTGTTYIISAIA